MFMFWLLCMIKLIAPPFFSLFSAQSLRIFSASFVLDQLSFWASSVRILVSSGVILMFSWSVLFPSMLSTLPFAIIFLYFVLTF